MDEYDPKVIEPKWQAIWEAEHAFEVSERFRGCGEVVRPRAAPVPVRLAAHGAPAAVHDRRRRHALPAAQRLQRAAPDGLRLVRPAGRERGHQGGRRPARDHRAQHREHQGVDAPDRVELRLVARDLHPRSGLHPLAAVAVPALLRARARLSQGGAGQVVPQRPDGAGERAGHGRRPLRTLRRAGRDARPGAVVLPHHRLRAGAARRPGRGRLPRADRRAAAQLDRAVGGRGGRVPHRGAGRGRARSSRRGRTRSSVPPSPRSRPSTSSSSASPSAPSAPARFASTCARPR